MTVMPQRLSGAMIAQLAAVSANLPALVADHDVADRDDGDAMEAGIPAFVSPGRTYVSADRLRGVLRDRLGCIETPLRERHSTYWLAPDGRQFRVLDPVADPVGRPMLGAHGRMQEVYTVFYVRALLNFLLHGCSAPN